MKTKVIYDYINVISCNGAACISLNRNIKKYGMENTKHRILRPKIYRYENSKRSS